MLFQAQKASDIFADQKVGVNPFKPSGVGAAKPGSTKNNFLVVISNRFYDTALQGQVIESVPIRQNHPGVMGDTNSEPD
jgi:hypothetical protein